MSNAALEALVDRQRALLAALDADDVDGITRHTEAMQDALAHLGEPGPLVPGEEARRLVTEAMTLAEAARVRVNVLADMTERRLARLAATTGKGKATPTYGRTGRISR